jgi:hypothetical protein
MYRLYLREPNGNWSTLDESRTLAENGVEMDAELRIGAELAAACFLPQTLVSLAEDKQFPIHTLRPGDALLSYDTRADRFCPGFVSSVVIDRCEAHLVINDALRVSPEHPILTERGWVRAGELSVGERLISGPQMWVLVESVRTEPAVSEVWNLAISNPEQTFVADGVIVASVVQLWDMSLPETIVRYSKRVPYQPPRR